MTKKVAIIGKMPPPIGGVTIHVKRLAGRLGKEEIPYLWIDLSQGAIHALVELIRGPRLIHLHTSSPYWRMVVAIIGRAVGKKVCITYHGNLGRFGWFANLVDSMSVRIASLPILLNEGSFAIARGLNGKSCLISSFIRPEDTVDDLPLLEMLTTFASKFDCTFATNAFNVSFDHTGLEIYGISGLISVFEELPEVGLVFSDPTGNYSRYLTARGVRVPGNVLVVDREHEFVSVLERVDGLIRATTTDGDSLSVREALFLGKSVVASDCVDRPEGVLTYRTGNLQELRAAILSKCRLSSVTPVAATEDGADRLMEVYHKLLP